MDFADSGSVDESASPGSTRTVDQIEIQHGSIPEPQTSNDSKEIKDCTKPQNSNVEESTFQPSNVSQCTNALTRLYFIDKEICETNANLAILRKKFLHLQSCVESDIKLPPKQTGTTLSDLAATIYAENRRKAESNATGIYVPPLYNQPSDIKELADIRERDMKFKPQLVKYLQNKAVKKKCAEETSVNKCEKQKKVWLKNLPEHDKKQEVYRKEFLEVFGEIKSESVNNDRIPPVKAGVKKQILARAALVPPLFQHSLQEPSYKNNDSIIEGMTFEKNNYWLPKEHELFKPTLLNHDKKCNLIDPSYPKKRCIEHYYLSKNFEKYKENKKTRRKKRSQVEKSGFNQQPKGNSSHLSDDEVSASTELAGLSKMNINHESTTVSAKPTTSFDIFPSTSSSSMQLARSISTDELSDKSADSDNSD